MKLSLQRVFGKDDKFFRLLEASAEEARSSVQSLVQLLKAPEQGGSLAEFNQTRRKDKLLTREITEHLCKAFATPLEREDIEALSKALYKIPKTVEKFSERLLLAPQQMRGVDFSRHSFMLGQATDMVVALVKELRRGVHLERVKEQNDRLQQIEGDADKLMLESLRVLYGGQFTPTQVMILKDLFELLEKIFDRCRDAGNIVFHIVLKHS